MTENVLKESDDNNSAFYSNSSDADGIEGGSRSLVPFMNDLDVVDPVESARKEAIDQRFKQIIKSKKDLKRRKEERYKVAEDKFLLEAEQAAKRIREEKLK